MKIFKISLGLIILLIVPPAFGQELSNVELSQKVAELEKRVILLEQFLTANNITQTNGAPNTAPMDVINWRKLKIGMTEESVRAVLGEPLKIDRLSTDYYTWYYSPDHSQSSIRFDRKGVAGWSEPE